MKSLVAGSLPLVLIVAVLAVAVYRRGRTEPWSRWSAFRRTLFLFGCLAVCVLLLAADPDLSNSGLALAYALIPLLVVLVGLYVYITGSADKERH